MRPRVNFVFKVSRYNLENMHCFVLYIFEWAITTLCGFQSPTLFKPSSNQASLAFLFELLEIIAKLAPENCRGMPCEYFFFLHISYLNQ